jgi:hypothetical protein
MILCRSPRLVKRPNHLLAAGRAGYSLVNVPKPLNRRNQMRQQGRKPYHCPPHILKIKGIAGPGRGIA